MKLGRREFVKLTAAATAVTAFGGLGFDLAPTKAHAQLLSLRKGKETTSVCCYCSVGCGLIVTTDEKTNRAINIEGDPDHPINEGALCAKGAAIYQLSENPKRITTVQYRAPGSDKWEEKSWDWALTEIAKRVKKSVTNPLSKRTPRVRSSTARKDWPPSDRPPWTTRSAGSTRPSSAVWV